MEQREHQDDDLSASIAAALRASIVDGRILVDERLPSEAELAATFGVSRPTVREALKRLAAQSLIRTRRGASGGAFVNRLSYSAAFEQQITTSTLLLSMNNIDFRTAAEARFALEAACAPMAANRRNQPHLEAMRQQIARQTDPTLSDTDFCASDVMFHRAFVDAAGNPVMSYQLAGVVEAIQPLMNMITYSARDRDRIVALHSAMADALEARQAPAVLDALERLCTYTIQLAETASAARKSR